MGANRTKTLQGLAYLMIAVIAVLTIGVFKNCGKINYYVPEGFSKGDTIDIALIYSPGSYYYYGDSLSGINKELAAQFSNETGTPIKIWPVTEPAEALNKLNNKNYDVLASLPLDNNLRKNFLVSESVFLDRLVLVQKGDSLTGIVSVNSSLDLDGKEVNVVAGSSGVKRLQNLSEEIGGKIDIKELPEMSDELICLKVASGEIPLALVNEKVVEKLSKEYTTLKYVNTVSFTQFQVWTFNREDTVLYQKFNKWFDTFRGTPEYRNIIEKF